MQSTRVRSWSIAAAVIGLLHGNEPARLLPMRKDLMTHEQWVGARQLGRPSWIRRTLALPVLMAVGYVNYKASRYGFGEELSQTAAFMTVFLRFTTASVYGIYDHSERAHEDAPRH